MRLLVGYILVLVGIVFVQSAPVVRQAIDPPVDFQGIDSEFDELLAELADILTPEQYQAFQQELFEMMMSEAANGIDPDSINLKFELLLKKYLGLDLKSRSDSSPNYFAQKFVEVVVAFASDARHTSGKRQAVDVSSINLEAILAAVPQLSPFVNYIHGALAQLATILSPAQLKSLQEQILEFISSVAVGNIDVNQFKEKLQALLQPYFNSNGGNQVDIDRLIEQVLATDTADLPNIIVNVLGKRDVHVK